MINKRILCLVGCCLMLSGLAFGADTPQRDKTERPQNYRDCHPYREGMTSVDCYRQSVERKITQKWRPPVYTEKKSAKVHFQLDRKGKLLDVRMKEASGIPALDESIQEAVLKAAPFKAFPKGLDTPEAPFEFTFDYVPHQRTAAER